MDVDRYGSSEITPLKVRVRQVFAGDGETTTTESVYCPALERSAGVSACGICGYCQGLSDRPGDQSIYCEHAKASDLTRRYVPRDRQQPDRTRVAELMTTHVLCVRPDVSLDALSRLLLERRISAVPVVDERGAPIGMVSKTDVVQYRYENGDAGALDRSLEPGFHESALVVATVADVMAPVPITASEEATVAHVAAAMAHERVHSLPIVARDGTVVGILSSLDIAGWYAQREGYVMRPARR